MSESEILFCEITSEVVEQAVICPFLIPGQGESDYCGYYGKDIGEDRRRLGFCKIEDVIERAEAARRRNKEKEERQCQKIK